MEFTGTSIRSPEQVAEQVKEEEAVARSGDSGVGDDRNLDPWLSGELELLRKKWYEQQGRRLSSRISDEMEAQSGDSGDRAIRYETEEEHASKQSSRQQSSRRSNSPDRANEPMFSVIEASPSGLAPEEVQIVSPVSPFVPHMLSPLSDNPLIPAISEDKSELEGRVARAPGMQLSYRNVQTVKPQKLHRTLEYTCNLAHLATFGIIGVLIRYGLEVLFSPTLGVMNDETALFIDLPANMVGSFFMGWVGIILKKHISLFSEPLAVGLSTGLMGSITTFASWNQKMVILFTKGHWASALVGYLIGMELAQMSLLIGVESATFLKWLIAWIQNYRARKGLKAIPKPTPDNFHRRMVSLFIFFFFGGFLWAAAVVLVVLDRRTQRRRALWLACVVAPPGVWARWRLARLNGQGLGSMFKWLPIGTLLTNLIAASLEAALSLALLSVSDDGAPLLIGGLQLGFLGCMSTVSTFVAEVYTMHGGPMRFRSYAYALGTLLPAFVLGLVIYSIGAWAKEYVSW